jgi:hypothetical protein
VSNSNPDERPLTCGDLVGLLAEPTRRAAFAALVLGATSVGAVAEKARLTGKEAASALRKLVDGRLAVENREANSYSLIEDAFRRAIQIEARVSHGDGRDGAGTYFRRGRLTAIPGDPKVRARVLLVVADSLTPGKVYSEPQVNAVCGEWFDDWVTLRRALVDEGLLTRDHSGTAYRRA